MNKSVLSVIGGGASGMAAAIEAARFREKTGAGIKIVIYERLPRYGKKILATGNGRCNILNKNADMEKYSGGVRLAKKIFGVFTPESNTEFFNSMGLYTRLEDDGRMYPMSLQASSVLDALRFELQRLGVEIICDTKITDVKQKDGGFILNGKYFSDAVIIAGGGKSSPVQGSDGSCFELLHSLGIKLNPQFPSLTGIILKSKNKSLKGLRARGEILVVDNGKVSAFSSGELQYTDYGVSGIPAMEVSRAASEHFALHKKGKLLLSVNSLPDFSPEEISEYIENRKKQNPYLPCEDLLTGLMPKKLGIAKLNSANIKCSAPISSVTKNQCAALTEILCSELFEISGVLGFEHSQVTAGGADTECFNNATLEALSVKGLFACGEVMDVDGRCGGYNLAWAWSSGRCAGLGAAKYLSENKFGK